MLAAGGNGSAAARELGLQPTTVNRWISETDPAVIARYVQEKRAAAQRIVLSQIEAATSRLMESIQTIPLTTGKDLQAATVSLGILDDHFGGRQAPGSAGRFGSGSLLDGWTERDRITLERIERVTLDPPGVPKPEP